MARITAFSLLSILLFSMQTIPVSAAASASGTGGSVLVTATTNGTYTLPTKSATSTGANVPKTTSSQSPAVTSAINAAPGVSVMMGNGKEVLALMVVGLVGGAVLGF